MKDTVKVPHEQTRLIAQRKVEAALVFIEHAQDIIGNARSELSSIEWGAEAYNHIGDMYDKLKELHFIVRTTIPWSRIDLDSDAKAKLQR